MGNNATSTYSKNGESNGNTKSYNTVIGHGANASNTQFATAIGANALAAGSNALAIGEGTKAMTKYSIAIGKSTNVTADEGIGAGYKSTVTGLRGLALGYQVHASSQHTIALGAEAKASGENSTAIGLKANVTNISQHGIAIGREAGADGQFGIAMGFLAKALNSRALAIGSVAKAFAENSTALGAGAVAESTATNSTAVGRLAKVYGTDSVAMGLNTSTSGAHSIAIGDNSLAGTALDKMSELTEAKKKAEEEEKKAKQAGEAAKKKANGDGQNAYQQAYDSYSNVSRKAYADLLAAAATKTIAIGHGSNVYGNQSISVGSENKVSGVNSGVLGTNNNVANNSTFVLGSNVKSTQDNSVILGANSTDRVATVENSAVVGGYAYSGFHGVGKEGNGVVSVGFQGGERQIINVAAGNISATSTDAINGSQLYLVGNSIINQMPVIYTDDKGNKVYKLPDGSFVSPDGSPVTSNVIASMNDGDNQANTPKTLANVKGNLPDTYNVDNKYNPENKDITKSQSLPTDLNVNNAATVGDILNSGWNLKNNGQVSDFVKPYDSVDFANGTATTAVVEPSKDGNATTIKYNVNVDNETITTKEVNDPVTQKPITQLTAKTTTLADDNQDGKIDDPTEKNALVTAENITKAINASGFTLKTSATTDGEKDKTSTPENGELINPGDSVEMIAGKNLTVKQENGKVTYSTKEEVDFNKITLSTGEANQVNLVNGAPVAMNANVNPQDSQPTASLNITSADNKPTQLTGVGSVLNTMQIETNTGTQPQGSAQKGTDNLLNLGGKDKPLENDVLNSAATVRDLTHLGWVVSASGNGYKNTVKNANEVNFVGANGISVTGETKENVREIKISVDSQSAVESAQLPVVYTNKAGDKLVKVGDKFYKAGDVTDGKPKNDATPVETKDVIAAMNNGDNNTTTPMALSNLQGNLAPTYNAGDKKENENKKLGNDVVSAGDITKAQTAPDNVTNIYHNAATVGDILNAGWNLQANGEGKDFVKAYDAVNFANGVGTTVNVEVAEDGKTSAVRINSLLGITDKEGNQVVKGKNGKYYKPSALKPNGEPKDNVVGVDAGDVQVNVINPAAADKGTKGDVVQVGNLSSGLSTQNVETKPTGKGNPTGSSSLLNLNELAADGKSNKVPDSNAATVGDLRNMGWELRASGNDYIDTVKNANKVDFVGSGLATVTGETKGDVRTITVDVDAQAVTNNARLPVVYTDKNGKQLYPIKDKDGNITYNTKPDGQGETVEPDNVITSINGPKGTTTPTVLTNVMSNLPETYNDDAYNLNKKAVTKNYTLPTHLNVNNAATVGDILNAGWNLKNNGQPGDFVKAYDSVDFIDGKGTTAVVETTKDGTSTTVKYDAKIDNNTIKLNDKGELYADYAGDIAKATTKVAAGNNIDVTPTVNPDGSTTYTVATKDDVAFKTVNVGDNVNINRDGLTIKDGPRITVAGIDGGNKKITGVANGDISPTSHDAINGSQLYAVQQALTSSIAASKEEVTSTDNSVTVTATPNDSGANVFDLSVNTDNTTITKDATTGALKAKTTTLSNTNGKVDTPAPENANALVSAQDIASAINQSGFTLTAQGENGSTVHPGATVDMKNTDGNIVISKSAGSNDVTYNLARDINVDQVRAGNTVLNNKGVTIGSGANPVELTENGLNNGGNRITNVAPGQAPTDAVNVSQLRGQMGNVYQQMNKMDKDLRGGIAGAMAAAGLYHATIPGKSMVSAGVGSYRDQGALAVGYSRLSDNGKLGVKLSINANTRGDTGAAASIGYQW
ncbi:autotransporter adhesin [[Pasteurella] mairii]|uniref:Autotransporter adhesin n=1 Tax=[Pasteurella] mairii TaxID=757 RepID=A0A379B4N3_9PAST|nr:autotransporter adhesin [[Pasteurella] mairii]